MGSIAGTKPELDRRSFNGSPVNTYPGQEPGIARPNDQIDTIALKDRSFCADRHRAGDAFLAGLAFLADLPLAGATWRAGFATPGFLAAFGLESRSRGLGDAGLFCNRRIHRFSLRGVCRGDHIHHSGREQRQVNSTNNLKGRGDGDWRAGFCRMVMDGSEW